GRRVVVVVAMKIGACMVDDAVKELRKMIDKLEQ
nr:hypothetical protein [Tanacetum cinerariifolium]